MDSFILYRSTLDALMALPPEDFRDAVCMIAEYDMDGKIPEKPGVAYAMFLSVRPLIDKRKKCAEAGRIGGLKRVQNQQNATSTPEATSEAPLKRFQGKEERRKKKEENNNKDIVLGKPETEYPYKEIIDYLNDKAGKKFLDKSKDTRDHIRARFNEGRTLQDFFLVIDNMTAAWKDSARMNQYLRPSTLFGSSKNFENYMNAKPQKEKSRNSFNNFQQRDYDYTDMERRLLGG